MAIVYELIISTLDTAWSSVISLIGSGYSIVIVPVTYYDECDICETNFFKVDDVNVLFWAKG